MVGNVCLIIIIKYLQSLALTKNKGAFLRDLICLGCDRSIHIFMFNHSCNCHNHFFGVGIVQCGNHCPGWHLLAPPLSIELIPNPQLILLPTLFTHRIDNKTALCGLVVIAQSDPGYNRCKNLVFSLKNRCS